MTRGTLFIIEMFRKRIRVTNSCEFNGDMYEEKRGGHGGEVMRLLEKTTNQKEFKENVKEFDKENFDYQSEGSECFKFYETHPMEWKGSWLGKQGNLITVSFKDYFPNFFSDWTFWKNCTEDCEVQLTTFKTIRRYGIVDLRPGKKHEPAPDRRVADRIIKLKPGETVAVYFGYYEHHYRGVPMLIKGDEK